MSLSNAQFRPGVAVNPTSLVEVSVSCRNLKDKDVFSKSDPMCILYIKEFGSQNFREFGRTECIKDTLNPDFVRKFLINYHFEESQKLRFDIYDQDSPSARLDRHDYLGSMECTLAQIVGAPSSKVEKPLQGPGSSKWGNIIVRAEELSNCKEIIQMQFCAHKLDKKDFLGKSDPFLVFSRCNEDSSWTVVHKTEVIKYNLNPTWRAFRIKAQNLCNGDYERQIKVDCYDWDSDGGSHDFIGFFQTNLKQLLKGNKPENTYDVINPKKKAKKRSYKNSGTCTLLSISIEQEYSFLDFIKGGMEVSFTVAIDFTASNGNPSSPTSLHYMSPYQPNQYASALMSVGEIIQDYDTHKMFPALGFGAKVPPDGRVSHEFFLNGSPNNPYCHGIGGLMEAYNRALHTVQLYGPTNFSPIINHVAKFAAACQDGSKYFILLIITDGVITDMDQTKSAIVAASKLPMSIIIVGVGQAEFDAMEELDSDNVRLCAYGRYAERDIVQFVPYREFMNRGNPEMQKALLAKEVLAEVPDQVTGFMKKIGMKPKPPRERTSVPSSTPTSQPPPPQSGGSAAYPGSSVPNQPASGASYPGAPAAGGYPGAPGGYPGAPGGYQGAPGGYPGAPGGYPGASYGQSPHPGQPAPASYQYPGSRSANPARPPPPGQPGYNPYSGGGYAGAPQTSNSYPSAPPP